MLATNMMCRLSRTTMKNTFGANNIFSARSQILLGNNANVVNGWVNFPKHPPIAVRRQIVPRSMQAFGIFGLLGAQRPSVLLSVSKGIRHYTTPVKEPPKDLSESRTMSLCEKAEKMFFVGVVVVWDSTVWLFTGTKEMVKTIIVSDPVIYGYVKKFIEKMESARKN